MNNTALPLSEAKRKYFQLSCLASLFGGQILDQPWSTYVIQVISVLQTFFLAQVFYDSYVLVLIIPAIINLILQVIQNYLIAKEFKKTFPDLGQLLGLLASQTVLTASAARYGGTVLDPIVFFFLFPRDRNVEFGFTTQEKYSRSKYAILYLKLMLICTHVGRETAEGGLRVVYYLTPLLVWLGLYGQFSQLQDRSYISIEYVAEQFNFFMGSSYCYSRGRTYLNFYLNVILVVICVGFSYINDSRAALIALGCLSNIKLFNIFGSLKEDEKQLYKSSYFTRNQRQLDFLQVVINVVAIILCGILASGYYKELFYSLIPIYFVFWIFQFKVLNLLRWHKMIVTVVQCACISIMDYEFDDTFAYRLFRCTTIVRLYGLIHSNPNYLFFEQLVCFIVSFKTDYSMSYCQLIGFVVQFAIRFLIRFKSRIQIWGIANYKMLTVKKQKVEKAWIITLLQVVFLHIPMAQLIVSCLFDVPYLPLFGLPYFTFASLRPYRNSVEVGKHIEGNSESSIYNSFLSQAADKLLTGQPQWSHYLLRVGKYIGIVQILEQCGGYAVIQFKGLESQETTSCHGIEAREVDRIIEAKDQCSCSALKMVSEFKVNSYEENQIILTGIIEASDFVKGFKKIYLKMLCYYAQDIQENHQKTLVRFSREFDSQEHYFPNEFANLIKLSSKFEFTATEIEEKQFKSPTVKVQIKHDDDDVLNMLNDFNFDQPIPKKAQPKSKPTGSVYTHLQRTLLYLYQISLQDLDFNFESRLNQKLLFELFQSPKMLTEKRQMQGAEIIFSEIVTKAIRSALKLSVDIYSIEGHLSVDDSQLIEELSNLNDCYVGMGTDSGWQGAMQSKLQLWSLGYDAGKNKLTIYRQSHSDIQCQMLRFNSEVIRGIEANLQMELLFATNDDEERYSIQTHEQFFRNMIIEGSELPLGYAPFYSGPVVISLR